MKRILLVDDEHFVRVGIKSNIDWKKNGFVIEDEAENGAEALEKIMCRMPDIVFLDITMPVKSGLEVLKEVRERGYKGYIVMLTCHEEFRLVQQAMRFGADDYVLKNDLIGDKMLHFLTQIPESRFQEVSRASQDEPEDILGRTENKINFLKNALCFGGMEMEYFLASKERYDLKLAGTQVYLILIQIRDLKKIMKRYEGGDTQVLFHAVDNMTEECLKKRKEYEHFWMNPDRHVILLTFSHEVSEVKIYDYISQIISQLVYSFEAILNIEATIAVNRTSSESEDLNDCYENALHLLEQEFFYKGRHVFSSQEYFTEADIDELEQLMSAGRRQDERLENLICRYLEYNKKKRQLLNRNKIFKVINHYLVQDYVKLGKSWSPILEECESSDDMIRILADHEEEMLRNRENSGYGHVVSQAVKIIDAELDQEIMLESIAGRLGLSASYFSRIFSKETGTNFSTYLTEQRIEKAKLLIRTTNLKFYEIAEQCGFNSAVHFNNMFKKICGITPNQFRNGVQTK